MNIFHLKNRDVNLFFPTIFTFIAVLLSPSGHAQQSSQLSAKFTVKPNKCISLHKGQVCYQKLKFQWAINGEGEFCLYKLSQSKALVCWKNTERSRYEYAFESANNEKFQIRLKGDSKNLAEVEVKLAWVYRTGKKSSSGWRLF